MRAATRSRRSSRSCWRSRSECGSPVIAIAVLASTLDAVTPLPPSHGLHLIYDNRSSGGARTSSAQAPERSGETWGKCPLRRPGHAQVTPWSRPGRAQVRSMTTPRCAKGSKPSRDRPAGRGWPRVAPALRRAPRHRTGRTPRPARSRPPAAPPRALAGRQNPHRVVATFRLSVRNYDPDPLKLRKLG